jgi:glutamate racemase
MPPLLTRTAPGNIIIREVTHRADVRGARVHLLLKSTERNPQSHCNAVVDSKLHTLIAIFDSGLGGLTAVRELHLRVPGAGYIYFGDTGRVPYGTRSRATIIKYALQDMRFLLAADSRLSAVLIACGTVSATALDVLRENFDLPIFGVVESAAVAAAAATKNNRVAVIATTATINSGAYERELHRIRPDISVTAKACPLFVPLVENGFTGGDDVTRMVCERYLAPVRESGADTCILGCTHYPLIREEIAQSLPGVTLIDTGAEAVKAIAPYCKPGEEGEQPRYFVSDDPEGFTQFAARLFGDEWDGHAELVDIDKY